MTSASGRDWPPGVGSGGALLVGGAVLVSSLTSVLPQFRFESQTLVFLPLLAWGAAAGFAAVADWLGRLLTPWRAAGGLVSLAPYVLLLIAVAATRGPRAPVLPWWLALVAAVSAAIPFVIGAFRATAEAARPPSVVTPASQRGTFVLALVAMGWAWSSLDAGVVGAILQIVLAALVIVAGIKPGGLAHAASAWRPAHWASLLATTFIIWAAHLIGRLTPWLGHVGIQVAVVLLAGLPLAIMSMRDGRLVRTRF